MIYTSHYKDQPAITLETGHVRAQFLPTLGGKLSSLTALDHNFDVLIHRLGESYRVQPYDGVYVDGECSGVDDMFPTIDLCYCEDAPWQGVKLADHGEVWSLPWSYQIDGERLHLSVHGVRLPYRLDKTASFADERTLRIDYTLTNLSPFPFHFLWAAHPMLRQDEDSRLLLPEGANQIANVFSANGDLGGYGDVFDWPIATTPHGHTRDLSRMTPRSSGHTTKYYIKGAMPAGWCALTYPSRKLKLEMTFPVDKVPYLGVLPGMMPTVAGADDPYIMFLEPATASFDRPDVARQRRECSRLPGNGVYTWHLSFSLQNDEAH
jgi:hypothetical protein